MEKDKAVIEYWYDRHTRYWVVIAYENHGSELTSEYCPDKSWRDDCIKSFAEKYQISDIRRVS